MFLQVVFSIYQDQQTSCATEARQWRNGVAHDQKYADLADTSLVTRVFWPEEV